MHWDDSGARETFFLAKERHEAGLKGLAYPVSLPSPDLYIQYIDWDKREIYDLPDSADELSTQKEKKWHKRRRYRGGKGGSRVTGSLMEQEPTESPGWKRINYENAPSASTGWGDMQPNLVPSGWELPVEGGNSLVNIPPSVHEQPVSLGWNLSCKLSNHGQCHGQSSEWKWQREHTYNSHGGAAYRPVGPASGWDHHLQIPGGLHTACTTDNRRPNQYAPGQWDPRLSGGMESIWAYQNQHMQQHPIFGNLERAYGVPSTLNRLEKTVQKWHLDASLHYGTKLYFP